MASDAMQRFGAAIDRIHARFDAQDEAERREIEQDRRSQELIDSQANRDRQARYDDLFRAYDMQTPQPAAAGDKRMRLLGFERVMLNPGQSKQVSILADPRLLARFDSGAGKCRVAEGQYRIVVGKSAEDVVLNGDVQLNMRLFVS